MDKKNLLIGLGFILAAFAVMFYQSSQMEPVPPPERQERIEEVSERTGDGSGFQRVEEGVESEFEEDMPFRPVEEVEEEVVEETPQVSVEEEIRTLSNSYIEVDFTTRGGAIKEVRFLQTKRGGLDDFIFNVGAEVPALGLSLRGPESVASFLENYRIDEDATSSYRIVFSRTLGGAIEVRRVFVLQDGTDRDSDPYRISHQTQWINRSNQPLRSDSGAYINVGTVYSIGADRSGEFLNFGVSDGNDIEFVRRIGFLGFGSKSLEQAVKVPASRLMWGAVKNQFFAFVATVQEDTISNGYFAHEVLVRRPDRPNEPRVEAINGALSFPIERIEAGDSFSVHLDFYTGPKEMRRLARLGYDQDDLMQFGIFGFFSKILLSFMYLIHTVVPSWGWSIVVMTICIKLLFWPLTAKAAKSQKRMQKIQQPMKELREKYKDNPQKMQKETMKLFRENKVNPAAGCLPILIQMPIFLGLFWMLRTSSELRYAPFLWISDLSRPDTVAEVFGFPINILPLLMGATMYFQMQMTPSLATADPMQQKIFKLLPFVFLVILYNFSSGLVLYWTVQNLLTILQQYITNKRTDIGNEPVIIPGAPKAKKKGAVKNPSSGVAKNKKP